MCHPTPHPFAILVCVVFLSCLAFASVLTPDHEVYHVDASRAKQGCAVAHDDCLLRRQCPPVVFSASRQIYAHTRQQLVSQNPAHVFFFFFQSDCGDPAHPNITLVLSSS